MYQETKCKVKDLLATCAGLTVTADGWTSQKMKVTPLQKLISLMRIGTLPIWDCKLDTLLSPILLNTFRIGWRLLLLSGIYKINQL